MLLCSQSGSLRPPRKTLPKFNHSSIWVFVSWLRLPNLSPKMTNGDWHFFYYVILVCNLGHAPYSVPVGRTWLKICTQHLPGLWLWVGLFLVWFLAWSPLWYLSGCPTALSEAQFFSQGLQWWAFPKALFTTLSDCPAHTMLSRCIPVMVGINKLPKQALYHWSPTQEFSLSLSLSLWKFYAPSSISAY